MSWLKLKRLLPHRKVWKVLTNKLPLKLIKSKPKKKPKNRPYKPSKKLGWPSLSIQPKKFKKQPNSHTLIHHKNHHRLPPPVFVDQLFIEPVSSVKEHTLPPESKEKLRTLDQQEFLDRKSYRPESSTEEGSLKDDIDNMVSADDAWESMVLASPQMHGINERAEEFIARFRAEMRHQEMMARRL